MDFVHSTLCQEKKTKEFFSSHFVSITTADEISMVACNRFLVQNLIFLTFFMLGMTSRSQSVHKCCDLYSPLIVGNQSESNGLLSLKYCGSRVEGIDFADKDPSMCKEIAVVVVALGRKAQRKTTSEMTVKEQPLLYRAFFHPKNTDLCCKAMSSTG